LKDELFAILDPIGDSLKDVRDRALLLLGFAGGFRRSELVGLDVTDIETFRQGIIITLRHSKTDQDGAGRKIGIPHGRTQHCPVAAVTAWLARSAIAQGAVFCAVTRYGHLQPVRLSGDAVSEVIRERLAAIGINPEGYSGHSLRAGFATSAAQAGVSTLKIRAQTGHTSDAMLSRYVRDGNLFTHNATAALL
jgi:integrase